MSILLPLVAYVDLSKGKQAIVDWFDLEWVQAHRWYFKESIDGSGYAARIDLTGGKRTLVSMHKAVFLNHNPQLEADALEDIDHINMSKLDNRSCNLRAASRHQNSGNRGANKNNTSGYKGVSFCKQSNCWKAQIMDRGVKRSIGYYATPEEAALAYNDESIKVFGDFAYLNEGIEQKDFIKLSRTKVQKPKKSNEGTFQNTLNGEWYAYIRIRGKPKYLGIFPTEAEAIAAFLKAKK